MMLEFVLKRLCNKNNNKKSIIGYMYTECLCLWKFKGHCWYDLFVNWVKIVLVLFKCWFLCLRKLNADPTFVLLFMWLHHKLSTQQLLICLIKIWPSKSWCRRGKAGLLGRDETLGKSTRGGICLSVRETWQSARNWVWEQKKR